MKEKRGKTTVNDMKALPSRRKLDRVNRKTTQLSKFLHVSKKKRHTTISLRYH